MQIPTIRAKFSIGDEVCFLAKADIRYVVSQVTWVEKQVHTTSPNEPEQIRYTIHRADGTGFEREIKEVNLSRWSERFTNCQVLAAPAYRGFLNKNIRFTYKNDRKFTYTYGTLFSIKWTAAGWEYSLQDGATTISVIEDTINSMMLWDTAKPAEVDLDELLKP